MNLVHRSQIALEKSKALHSLINDMLFITLDESTEEKELEKICLILFFIFGTRGKWMYHMVKK
jgi:hypothetical protein